MNEEPIVFISYTHDSEIHKARVLELSNRLRDEGVDCRLDRYETSPPEGWARWMTNQVKSADFVLVVCTETYERRFEGNEMVGKGLGAQWEGLVITQELYDSAARNTKFVPILFSAEDSRFIPITVRSATYYRVDTKEGYEDLYRRLTVQPRITKPPLGKKRVLSEGVALQPGQPVIIQKVIEKTVESSNAEQPKQNLFLIYLEDNARQFVPVAQVTVEEKTIDARLRPENARQKAFLADLLGRNATDFAVAYKDNAYLVRLEKSVQVHGSAEEWQLVLKLADNNRSSALGIEFSLNGYTGDDFAELRARRILLDEQIQKRDLWSRGSNDLGLIEHTVRQGSGFVKVYCPILEMRQQYQADDARFLEVARLMCVLLLQMNRVVKHIFTLELNINGANAVSVVFEGERAKQYSDHSATIIKVSGDCELTLG